MKSLLIAFAVIVAVAADVSHLPSNEYLPPVSIPTNEYLPPISDIPGGGFPIDNVPAGGVPVSDEPVPAHELTSDGYRYKTNRRVVYRRHRRDVSHLPFSNEYLPPVEDDININLTPIPNNEYLPPVQQEEVTPAHELAQDGYRYKTHRRVVYRRNRRDVSHLPSNEYLPPVPETPSDEVAPVQEVSNVIVEDVPPAHELTADGYHYKTNRRVVFRRHRRDVSHLLSNEYLPPEQDSQPVTPIEEVPESVNVIEDAPPAHELTDEGYRYKTHRRVVFRRNRRDVSHLPSNEYLPPEQDSHSVNPIEEVPVSVNVIEDAPPAHELADDGYHYKTHRRVVLRRH